MGIYGHDNTSHLYDYEYAWFPNDFFTFEQIRKGWIALHFIGVIYTTIASIVLSYNFFVPSVFMIAKKVKKIIDLDDVILVYVKWVKMGWKI